MAKIILPTQKLSTKGIFSVIYGEDGVGKSSFALTSKNPVTAVYDKGFRRAIGRQEAIEFSNWNDISEYFDVSGKLYRQGKPSPFRVDFPNCETLIHDTVGIMVDSYISQHVRLFDNNKRRDGSLSLSGYGAIKDVFDAFIKALERDGGDHVFVCHCTIPADDTKGHRMRPRITGSSYNILMERADMSCIIEMATKGRSFSFDSDDRKVGKNTANLPSGDIPNYSTDEYKTMMGDMIGQTRLFLEELSSPNIDIVAISENIESCETLNELDKLVTKNKLPQSLLSSVDNKRLEIWKMEASLLKKPEDFNSFSAKMIERSPKSKDEIKKVFSQSLSENNIKYDGKSGQFIKKVDGDTEKMNQIKKSATETFDLKVLDSLLFTSKKLTSEKNRKEASQFIEDKITQLKETYEKK